MVATVSANAAPIAPRTDLPIHQPIAIARVAHVLPAFRAMLSAREALVCPIPPAAASARAVVTPRMAAAVRASGSRMGRG